MTTNTTTQLFNQLQESLIQSEQVLQSEQSYSDWASSIMRHFQVAACSYDESESTLHSVLTNAARKQTTISIEVAAQWLDKAIEDKDQDQVCGHCGRSDRAFVSDCVNHCVDCDAKLQSAAGCGNSCYPDTHYDNN